MLEKSYPFYLANKAEKPNTDLKVHDKYSGKLATEVAMASPEHIDKAIGAAVKAQQAMQEMAPYERQAVLQHCVDSFKERHEELSQALCIEAGKPIKDARGGRRSGAF